MKRKQQERRPPAKSIRSEQFRSRAVRDLPGAPSLGMATELRSVTAPPTRAQRRAVKPIGAIITGSDGAKVVKLRR
jgi:hypothetical protein